MDEWYGVYPLSYTVGSSVDIVAAGIYHGNLDFDSNSDDLIDGAQLLPYPTQVASPSLSPTRQNALNSSPISMSLTEFHFLLLYRDRVLGISNLNEQLAYEELLPLVYILRYTLLPMCAKYEHRNRMSKYGVLPLILFARRIGYTRTSRYGRSVSPMSIETCGRYT